MDAASGTRAMDAEGLRARREARRRALRRRRILALVAVVLAIAAIVVLATRGGGSSPASTSRATTPSAPARSSSAHAGGQAARAVAAAPGRRPGTDAIPILMYHVIAAPPAAAPFPGLYVTPGEFAAQMQALKNAGWHAVTLDQVRAYWRDGVPLGPGKPIVLTFDNGYQSQYTQALPVLQRLGWVGDENIQLTGLPPSQGGLSSAQVRGLLAAGWELDTQGISHADLITLDAGQLREQVAGARATLQRRYGVPVNWFCYPSGHYDATVIAAVREAGYVGSTTVVPGWAHTSEDPYRLHRLRVLGNTSPAALLQLIADTRANPPAPPSYNGT
ncbi:MAG TPA: polysaccharide deacetylase family protein [Solirubrobacteraceae bacterium]|nr:polysaccharide deacetylase family protein [Solirubrobacteraceae bacterium]